MPSGLLVVSPDKTFTETLQKDPRVQSHSAFAANTGWEAQTILKDEKLAISALFLSPQIDQPHWTSLLRMSMKERPQVPVYLLLDEKEEEPSQDSALKNMGVRDIIRKPCDFKRLLEIAAPLAIQFDPQEALLFARKNSDPLGTETQEDDKSFSPILARNFVSGSTSYFDLYVRIPTGRYVKILKGGDAFTADRIQGYLEKGVKNFYLRAEAHESYVQFLDSLLSGVLRSQPGPNQSPEALAEFQLQKLLQAGEETVGYFRTWGVRPENLRLGMKYIQQVSTTIKQIKVQDRMPLKRFLENMAQVEHTSSTTFIACLVAEALEIQMERPTQVVGMAALLHHVGLYQLPEKFWNESTEGLTADELIEFQKHPTKAAQLLSSVKGVDLATIQAIEQHHMRQGGKGFPEKTGISLHPIGQLIGLSSQFAHWMSLPLDVNALRVRVEAELLPHFSRQIAYAFRTVFFEDNAQ